MIEFRQFVILQKVLPYYGMDCRSVNLGRLVTLIVIELVLALITRLYCHPR